MLRQAGVIRVENLHQLFDVARVVVHQPCPAGNRVAIVTNSHAPRHSHYQACGGWGLDVTHGPVALPSEASGRSLPGRARRRLRRPALVDSVLACFVPPLVTIDGTSPCAALGRRRGSDKTWATFLGMRGVDDGASSVRGTGGEGEGAARAIPLYPLPEDAAQALAAATKPRPVAGP